MLLPASGPQCCVISLWHAADQALMLASTTVASLATQESRPWSAGCEAPNDNIIPCGLLIASILNTVCVLLFACFLQDACVVTSLGVQLRELSSWEALCSCQDLQKTEISSRPCDLQSSQRRS